MPNLENIIKYTSSLKLLYVDDNKSVVESAEFLLKELFDDVIIAVDGQDAIDKFNNNNIDLIITDLEMPRLNGLDMIKEIRKINKDIPVIVLSAHTKPEYFMQSIKLNVQGYLRKPLDFDSMLDVLANVISNIRSPIQV